VLLTVLSELDDRLLLEPSLEPNMLFNLLPVVLCCCWRDVTTLEFAFVVSTTTKFDGKTPILPLSLPFHQPRGIFVENYCD